MSFKILDATPSADVASGGTITFSYPSGYDAGHFYKAVGHKLNCRGLQTVFDAPDDFTVSFGTSSITVTYNGDTPIPGGTLVQLQAEIQGADDDADRKLDNTVQRAAIGTPVLINLGAPDAADADGVSVVQTLGAAGNFTIGGALASGGVATFDVPRNVTLTGATTDHSSVTFTITGTDEYGKTVVEKLAGPNNSTVSGKKAFKTVTKVAVDGAIATDGVSVGSGDVLGLPVFLPETAFVVKELQDGAAATAGTLVAGDPAVATATTGDVRGTYDPNAACDGSKVFQLIAVLPDPKYLGRAQYAG